ncbi:hypothetical protein DESC_720220 [Desulfosarcina cetonica]|nr:hypothetical protein DESC_720220 [Desulfosarcina cetonica]
MSSSNQPILHFRGRKGDAVSFLGGQQRAFEVLALEVCVGIGLAFGGGPDGELEAFDKAVSELTGPHDILGAHHGHDGASQRYEIGVAANFNGLGGANFYAGKALPALIRFLVVGLHGVGIQNHQIVGTNVHASGLVATLAAVTFFLNYKTWHLIYLLR